VQYKQTRALPVHDSMRNVSDIIWETCKTYLWTQGKFLAILWLLIAACIFYYFNVLQENTIGHVILILLCSVLGILGSYGVAWFGIRINTVANSRTAFSALQGNPKNPGVIADCTGDNAGDSVGPTADGFETYGVTGVALIAFLALALAASPAIAATLIIWLFVMRSLMIVTSLVSYFTNEAISKALFGGRKDFDFEAPLTHLVWII